MFPQSIFPDPIALIHFVAGGSTIVRFIPTDGIEQEFAVSGAAIDQWLSADDVVWEFFDELRHERVERFGILTLRQMIALERTDYLAFVHQRLVSRCRQDGLGKIGDANSRQKVVRLGIARKNRVYLMVQTFEFPR